MHLSQARPVQVARFIEFLGRARSAQTLYLLGDIFDLWLGDDDHRAPHPEAETHLRTLTESGTRVFFMHGNHDFLLGEDFAHRTGCELLLDPSAIQLGQERVLMTHGDTLCTDDHAYQAYRAQVRDPRVQEAFLKQPLEERVKYADSLREHSQRHAAVTSRDITDVNQSAVDRVMREHRADILIHGHTHRPAIHNISTRLGSPAQRIVLSDWYQRDWILAYDGNYRQGSFNNLCLD